MPELVLTNQGRNFTLELFGVICHLLGIKTLRTTAYHPQSDGRIERFHRTLNNILVHCVHTDRHDWDKWVPYVLMVYCTFPHSATEYSPYYSYYGREMELYFMLPEGQQPQIYRGRVGTAAAIAPTECL